MEESKITRRDFNKLAAAALGGVVAGTGMAFGSGAEHPKEHPKGKHEHPKKAEGSLLTSEPHVCKGLNACKGKGAGGKNACAGTSKCATAKHHACHGHNECKGQGGCGATAGQNACKGKGNCKVPLNEKTWKKTKKAFEAAMKKKK